MITKEKNRHEQDLKNMTAIKAKFEAQKIAFAPFVFQATRTMRDLKILDVVGKAQKKGISIEQVATQTGVSEYGVRLLMDLGLDINLFYKEGELFKLSKIGYFVAHDELTQVNMDFTHDVCYNALFHLQEAIEKGEPAGLKVFGKWNTVYEALAHLPEQAQKSWFAFDHFYSDQAFPEALPLVFKHEVKTLLDIGGNTGKWSLQCVQYDPNVKITILDLPGQLAKAETNIKAHGFEDRVSGFPINLLTDTKDFPKGADAIWMSQFLVCFSKQEIVAILKKAAKAMNKDCTLFILDTYWDRQRFEAGRYSLHNTSIYFTCLANGNSRVYHSKDMISCVHEAGLYIEEDIDEVGNFHTLFKCRLKP
ncbi:MAG: SAM-dependent methyltransferase [Saprospiraceae bacterium]|nr:SAM-dependent methyltransferase [Saprospiraceae bacterium]